MIEIVDNYTYLGVSIGYTGLKKIASENLAARGRKACSAMRNKQKDFNDLSVSTQLKLFDTLISPILTYGCEIWISDYKIDMNNDSYPFESVQLKFCKNLTGYS